MISGNMKEISKHFDFEDQSKIYDLWEKNGYFKPKVIPGTKPFTIIMPPPNANGSLHIGHAVFVTLEDIMVRYHRMLGVPTLWLPGADHAGIQTQVVYEKELEKRGLSRFDLGREKFYQETYDFTMKNKAVMENQLRKLGASCDWSREHFTLEPEISKSVFLTFKKMYVDGLIYRGKRIINWCPRCGTALSDVEVIYKEKETFLTYIKYPIDGSKEFITVATTRPETMLGDTAVVVNPSDPRYKMLIGKHVLLPLSGRKIPIIGDEVVDKKFGTGAVKVTPAHDPIDFEISQRHDLEVIDVIGKDLKMTAAAGKEFEGLKYNVAREKVVSELKKLGLLVKETKYTHAVGTCERCKSIIEPLISEQWFVKIKPLAEKAIKAVKSGKIIFTPKRYEKVYYNWMENIRDWCISRQIWWGHRIPVYYCQDCNAVMVETEQPKKCNCGSTNILQDPDTLDTWFSSGQWPFNTLGWNEAVASGEKSKTGDFEKFYPTSVMETGWDILFFWVARMIMLGIYCTGEVPFKEVVLHGLVRDQDRVKMSKSKGNSIDPLGVVEEYGADAIRMALVFGTGIGNDIVVSEDKIKGFRNFSTKIWNASRFIQTNLEDYAIVPRGTIESDFTKEDLWILAEYEKTVKKVTNSLTKHNFHHAAEEIYEFFWHKFCDKTIEDTKSRIYGDNIRSKAAAKWVLHYVLFGSLKLLHPFMPFVTEAIWQNFNEKVPLIGSTWPISE
jgi:valyl-tRNA synthetase